MDTGPRDPSREAPARDDPTSPAPVTLITGAAGAIGSALASSLHARGDRLALIDLQEDALHESWGPTDHLLLGTDVTDMEAMLGAAERLDATWGSVNHIIVNAGALVERLGGFDTLDPGAWQQTMRVNLDSAYHTIKALLPLQIPAQGHRSIVIMSSILAMRGSGQCIAYSAAKAGLLGLMTALAQDLAQHRITVNAVAPFLVAKPAVDSLAGTALDGLTRRVPLGRIGSPQDIAEAVSYLTSPAASFYTGQTLVLDGGVSSGAWWHPYW